MTPKVHPFPAADKADQPAGNPPSRMKPMKPRAAGTVKAVVHQAFDEAGGIERVMTLTGLGRSRAYAMADDADDACHLQYRQAAALSAAGVTRFAEHLAALSGCVLLPVGPIVSAAPAAMTAGTAEDFAHLMARLSTALADGKVCPREAGEALPALEEMLRGGAALWAALMALAAGREG